MTLRIPSLSSDPASPFPPVETALDDPDGLLACGGDLSPARFLAAYRGGIFPWFSEGEPILWWSPSRRAVLPTDALHLPDRLRRKLRNSGWTVRADTAFAEVVDGCAAPRPGQRDTWITAGMRAAYLELHKLGHAHSIEVFDADARLIGGLFGLSFGQMFCGDSMYSARSGASSLALAALAHRLRGWGWPIIDAQVPNDHTRRLGVQAWPRPAYLQALARQRELPGRPGNWAQGFGELPAAVVCASAAQALAD
ncbi:MAG: leucyl/phenylalanyl-tRNA--protein transferase [Thermomonas sp.]|uniref:leucyl/phenylalanyl-tRNA--protein transferase n=1 Tax=Thermomonas sp. TaxID=1971895 RepID=UPI0039E3C79D